MNVLPCLKFIVFECLPLSLDYPVSHPWWPCLETALALSCTWGRDQSPKPPILLVAWWGPLEHLTPHCLHCSWDPVLVPKAHNVIILTTFWIWPLCVLWLADPHRLLLSSAVSYSGNPPLKSEVISRLYTILCPCRMFRMPCTNCVGIWPTTGCLFDLYIFHPSEAKLRDIRITTGCFSITATYIRKAYWMSQFKKKKNCFPHMMIG